MSLNREQQTQALAQALAQALSQALQRARRHAVRGEDQAAQRAYLEILSRDPTHRAALDELGTLAHAGGFRSAARTAYQQLVQHHPADKRGRVNLANLHYEGGDHHNALQHYREALRLDPEFAEAHQGLARILSAAGDEAAAATHWHQGFHGHALITKRYRGTGTPIPVLLLVSARSGNVPSQLWITPRHFTVHAIYAEYHDPTAPLPPHTLAVNLIGDADLSAHALDLAETILASSISPLVNPPSRVRQTGRAENARRLSHIPGVTAPAIATQSSGAILTRNDLRYPLLLRRPGFHTGQHFTRVENQHGLEPAIRELLPARSHDPAARVPAAHADDPAGQPLQPAPRAPVADELLVIEYLDARGEDGHARKYRVMFIDGELYPLHLAISADWKVHYFSAAMAQSAAFREEERRFLDDMPAVLGAKAMQALRDICAAMGLQYAGIDFALSPDGSVLLFEANATMVVFPPGPDTMWDYRRRAIDTVIAAATAMLLRHAGRGPAGLRDAGLGHAGRGPAHDPRLSSVHEPDAHPTTDKGPRAP
jgi:hypothetical protein